MEIGIALGMAAAMALFLVGERAHGAALRWIGKPLASAGFVALALSRGATDSAYGRWVLAALVLSWLGDVLLIPSGKAAFMGGLGSFLLGHLAFAAAFVARGISAPAAAVAGAASVVPAILIARWLLPHVEPKMRGPVIAYMIAISAMVSLAVATTVAAPAPLLLAGAIAF